MHRRAGLHFGGISNMLEKRTSRNLIKFNNGKCKVLQPERNNLIWQRSGDRQIRKQLCWKGPEGPGGQQVDHASNASLWQRQTTARWAALRSSPAKEVIFLLYYALVKGIWNPGSSSGSPVQKWHGHTGWSTWYMKRHWEFSLRTRRLWWMRSMHMSTWCGG